MPPDTAPPFLAFDAPDVERAHKEWGCNCGPAALAACLGWTLDAIRPRLGEFETRGHMSPTMMIASVVLAGHRIASQPPHWPDHGLSRIQWEGPWLDPGVPAKAAYRHTHWCASKRLGVTTWVYDVNSGWEPIEDWAGMHGPEGTAQRIMATIKRCRGTWKLTHCWEIRKEIPRAR